MFQDLSNAVMRCGLEDHLPESHVWASGYIVTADDKSELCDKWLYEAGEMEELRWQDGRYTWHAKENQEINIKCSNRGLLGRDTM